MSTETATPTPPLEGGDVTERTPLLVRRRRKAPVARVKQTSGIFFEVSTFKTYRNKIVKRARNKVLIILFNLLLIYSALVIFFIFVHFQWKFYYEYPRLLSGVASPGPGEFANSRHKFEWWLLLFVVTFRLLVFLAGMYAASVIKNITAKQWVNWVALWAILLDLFYTISGWFIYFLFCNQSFFTDGLCTDPKFCCDNFASNEHLCANDAVCVPDPGVLEPNPVFFLSLILSLVFLILNSSLKHWVRTSYRNAMQLKADKNNPMFILKEP
jgi:hypothetical protein